MALIWTLWWNSEHTREDKTDIIPAYMHVEVTWAEYVMKVGFVSPDGKTH